MTFGTQALTYDLNGNLTSDGANTYTWDARNRLTAVTGSVPATFIYDAAGRRSRKTINSVATEFVYDSLNPVQEQAGSTVTNLLTGLGVDEYFTRGDATSSTFFLADALGSIVGLTDGIGLTGVSYTYEPFGAATSVPVTNPLQYTGRENDGTDLHYYRARYYHPTLQRFLTEDPIGFASGDTHLYSYVGNNPLNLTDPAGLTWMTNAEFLLSFLFGGGDDDRLYKSTPVQQPKVQLQEMQASVAAQKMRAAFVRGGCKDRRDFGYGSFEAAWDTILNPRTADLSSTAAQVGGFANARIIDNRNGTMTITIPNEAGARSFFYHAVPNAAWQSGPLRTIRQTFEWTEAVPLGCRKN